MVDGDVASIHFLGKGEDQPGDDSGERDGFDGLLSQAEKMRLHGPSSNNGPSFGELDSVVPGPCSAHVAKRSPHPGCCNGHRFDGMFLPHLIYSQH